MRPLAIFMVVVLAGLCIHVGCGPVELDLEAKADSKARANSSSQEIETEITITMTTATETTTTATAMVSQDAQEIQIQTTNNPQIENEKVVKRGKCSGNGNRTQSKSGNVKLIPFPLCKPIQGLFHIGLCAVVCGLPLKSDENSCRFSNDDKAVFCDCGGAEEGETAACGSGLVRQTHCAHPELNPSARTCRNICGKLGKSYDFCMSPGHARRAFCTCFDASRTQKKSNRREIEDASEKIQEEIPAQTPSSTTEFTSSPVVKQEEIANDDDDVDVDVDDAEEESCDNDDKNGTGNGTRIKNLRQQNVGSCHPVLGAYRSKVCTGICGGGVKTCRVNKAYKTVYCDCPGNEEGPEAFCGRPAEMYKHCFRSNLSNKQDCQSICSQTGKRGEICLSPQNSQTLTMCSCFTG